jgi:hypothetical protein
MKAPKASAGAAYSSSSQRGINAKTIDVREPDPATLASEFPRVLGKDRWSCADPLTLARDDALCFAVRNLSRGGIYEAHAVRPAYVVPFVMCR